MTKRKREMIEELTTLRLQGKVDARKCKDFLTWIDNNEIFLEAPLIRGFPILQIIDWIGVK